MKKLLAVMLVAGLVFAACSSDEDSGEEGDEGGALPACKEAPAEVSIDLPADFPTPEDTTYTGGAEAGPSFIAQGYFDGDLGEAFDAYHATFEDAGYDVTKDEQEERDAEVFFESDDSSGQVNMFAECEGRTKLRITIRPAA